MTSKTYGPASRRRGAGTSFSAICAVGNLERRTVLALERVESSLQHVRETVVDPRIGSDLTGDGSLFAPYATIQRGLDAVAALPWVGTEEHILRVFPTAVGRYELTSPLIYTGRNALTIAGGSGTVRIRCSGGPVLVVTNATRNSIETFLSTRAWSDLANGGTGGCNSMRLLNLSLSSSTSVGNVNCVELIGVPGDVGPNTTGFMCWFWLNDTVALGPRGSGVALWAKNCGALDFQSGSGAQRVLMQGCAAICIQGCLNDTVVEYDEADPEGHHTWGFIYCDLYNATIWDDLTVDVTPLVPGASLDIIGSYFPDTLILRGTVRAKIVGSGLGRDNSGIAEFSGNVILDFAGTTLRGNVTIGDGVTGEMQGGVVTGTLSVAAGSGAISLTDCPVRGVISDPSARLSFQHGSVQRGTVIASGAGDHVVTLNPAYPGTAYFIQLTVEGANESACVKAGRTAGSFTITTGGACSVHWKTEL